MKRILSLLILAVLAGGALAQQGSDVYETLKKNYDRDAFEACIAMEKEVATFTRNRIDTLAANCFFYMGDAFNQAGDVEKALQFFEREKKALQALGMQRTDDYSNSLNNLAYLYLHAGDYENAGRTAAELIANDEKIFSPTDDLFVSTVLEVSEIYLQLDRLKDCETLLLNTLRRQRAGSVNRGLLLNKLGDLYSYTGRYTKATKYLNEALDVEGVAAGEESAGYISAAINLGILYMNEGKLPEAQEIFEVALTNLEPSEPAYAAVLNNQALVLQNLGQLKEAKRNLEEIKRLDSLNVGTSHPDYAITLSNLGLLEADLGNFDQAAHSLSRALSILKQNGEGNSISFARKLNNLAKVRIMAGAPGEAVPLLENALVIFRKLLGKDSPEYATATYNLGVALWKAGQGEKGFRYLQQSASIRSKVLGKMHPRYAESILTIAEYQWSKKENKKARQSFREVFDNYYFQIDQTFPVLTEEEKSKFYYTNIRSAFDKFNSFAMAYYHDDLSVAGDVYNYLVNTKGAIMLATEKVKSAIYASGDSSLIQEFELWQEKKEQIAKSYSLNLQDNQLDSLLTSANALEKDLARKSSVFAGQLIRRKYTWQEIQKQLQPGQAAVEVLRFRDYSPETGGAFSGEIHYAFLIVTASTTEQPDIVLLGPGKELEGKDLRYYRNNIKYHVADAYSYDHYFKPLGDYLHKNDISRIFFSPDGVYNQINLNSIQNPDTGTFLLDEYDIRLVTNTRELAEARGTDNGDGKSVLIGFPKFNLGPNETAPAVPQKNVRGIEVTRGWRGGLMRYMRGEEGLAQLPGTEVEVKKIANLLGEKSVVYTEGQASERMAKSVRNAEVLHIATHGYFLEDEEVTEKKAAYFSNPLLNAGLIFAGAENFLRTGSPINEAGDDGILTAYEAMNLSLENCDLVVLSACETGLGDIKNGEGVYGLQRAFKIAGAESIVMSLWNVDDDATQQLMTSFYEEMLRSGDQHLAFRKAQQTVREKYPSPFYWAAFIMVGI